MSCRFIILGIKQKYVTSQSNIAANLELSVNAPEQFYFPHHSMDINL